MVGIHLYLGLGFGNTLFILNALGYLGLLAALQLPTRNWRAFGPSRDGPWWVTRR